MMSEYFLYYSLITNPTHSSCILFFNRKLNNHPFEYRRGKFKKQSFKWDDRLSEEGAQLRTTGIWQSWDANICSGAMARQTIGRKGHYKNERDNLKETKDVFHGRRMGGTANGNARIKINIKKL